MSQFKRWLLPDGIEDLGPEKAEILEYLRRHFLDQFSKWGYRLVELPLVEFLDSLFDGSDKDLAAQTAKISDTFSGKMMGLRADMTRQASRFDACYAAPNVINRVMYSGSVFQNVPTLLRESRIGYQVGVELLGYNKFDGDLEVLTLLLDSVESISSSNNNGFDQFIISLGHIDILSGLIAIAGFDADQKEQLSDIYRRKSKPDMCAFIRSAKLEKKLKRQLLSLLKCGDEKIIDNIAKEFSGVSNTVTKALNDLNLFSKLLKARFPSITIHFDFSQPKTFDYHSGIIFSLYHESCLSPIAKGGAYDCIGMQEGQNRPGAGFSINLNTLLDLSFYKAVNQKCLIIAPFDQDEALYTLIKKLRDEGNTVIQLHQDTHDAYKRDDGDVCFIQNVSGNWSLVKASDN